MKKITSLIFLLFLSSCTSATQFGTGVNITFDPRTIGMQIDDTIMQKNLSARLALTDKKYFLSIQSEVIDGRIFISGKVDEPEEKIKITKARNYTLETVNKNIYIFGIVMDVDEKKEVINEANKIYDVEEVIPSIYLATELSRTKIN